MLRVLRPTLWAGRFLPWAAGFGVYRSSTTPMLLNPTLMR
jgi:hypothetical protein